MAWRRPGAWTAPSHYLSQCWNIVNWMLRIEFQWNINRNSNIFIQENALENVVCEMASILCRPQCVKDTLWMVQIRASYHYIINSLGLNFSEILTVIQTFSIFIQENALENVVCEMASILRRPQRVKDTLWMVQIRASYHYIINSLVDSLHFLKEMIWFKFNWSLFPRVQLTSHHWFR